MSKLLALITSILFSLISSSQDFNTLIAQTGDTLAKKIIASGKNKIAVTDFINIDESITQLGYFLSTEISSELVNQTENQSKFRVLERANLDQIFKEKHVINFTDPSGLAKELGKIDAADALIFATITDFDGYYRIVIKMLDTKNGDALMSYKVSFVKTPSLENLNKIIVKKGFQSSNPIATNSNETQTASTNQKGDYCFTNKGGGFLTYLAKLSVYKPGSDVSLKTISLHFRETGCIHDLPFGVYKIIISWYSGEALMETDVKEIRIKPGPTDTLELKKNN